MSLSQAFRDQAATCIRMGSPFMGRLLKILAENWPQDTALAGKMAEYQGDIGPAGHSLPLRIAGGLHALVLSARDPRLAAAYPPNDPDDRTLRAAILQAIAGNEAFLIAWTASPPQTNEVRRSAALIAMARVAFAECNLPIVLSELGASGGLNLMWDRYAIEINGETYGPPDPVLTLSPDWSGPSPPSVTPHIAARAGVDLNPLDPRDPQDLLRLTAYLWPDQPERMSLARAAAQAFDATVEKGDAIDWLADRLEAPPDGHLHLIQHTVAWQYFPAEAQARGQALVEAAGARATRDAPLGWMAMETDGDTTGQVGAALTLRLWPGDRIFRLGRADFHGRWIRWGGP